MEGHASRRPVGLWLLAVAAAVLVQVAIGGITRLTDSGLSITEWKPLLGVIPPLDDAGWDAAFRMYQELPQYQQLKSHLTLPDFKFIYFWEWFHRLWGRMLGLFFAVPFVLFSRRGQLSGLHGRLVLLFLLGGLQGVLGWFMVKSGLQELVYVSHFRLAAHYMAAMGLLAALVWQGAALAFPEHRDAPGLRRFTWGLLAVLCVQLTWGAFMAGLKAVSAAPTWPTLNGLWLPRTVWSESPFSDPLSVQFIHRALAYALAVGVAAWWWKARGVLERERHVVAGLLALQVVLGVLTVLYGPLGHILPLGLAHQLVGTVLFASLAWCARLLSGGPRAGPGARGSHALRP